MSVLGLCVWLLPLCRMLVLLNSFNLWYELWCGRASGIARNLHWATRTANSCIIYYAHLSFWCQSKSVVSVRHDLDFIIYGSAGATINSSFYAQTHNHFHSKIPWVLHEPHNIDFIKNEIVLLVHAQHRHQFQQMQWQILQIVGAFSKIKCGLLRCVYDPRPSRTNHRRWVI